MNGYHEVISWLLVLYLPLNKVVLCALSISTASQGPYGLLLLVSHDLYNCNWGGDELTMPWS